MRKTFIKSNVFISKFIVSSQYNLIVIKVSERIILIMKDLYFLCQW